MCERVLAAREEGIELRAQAVLFRTGHDSALLELELTRRGIPFVKYGGLRYLDAAHVKDLLALLRLVDNPADELSLVSRAAAARRRRPDPRAARSCRRCARARARAPRAGPAWPEAGCEQVPEGSREHAARLFDGAARGAPRPAPSAGAHVSSGCARRSCP